MRKMKQVTTWHRRENIAFAYLWDFWHSFGFFFHYWCQINDSRLTLHNQESIIHFLHYSLSQIFKKIHILLINSIARFQFFDKCLPYLCTIILGSKALFEFAYVYRLKKKSWFLINCKWESRIEQNQVKCSFLKLRIYWTSIFFLRPKKALQVRLLYWIL